VIPAIARSVPIVFEAHLMHAPEQITYFADEKLDLYAIIAIHSTALGPSLGGIRFWKYADETTMVEDAGRLASAMTMKAAVAGLQQGGGKTVVFWDDPRRPRTEEQLRVLGRWIDALGGRYLAAEDVGASQRDMDGIARETPWVTGVDPARGGSGDPSPVTAFGVVHGMRAACASAFGSPDLAGRHVVVQGAGHVGTVLAHLLVDAGARVSIADIDTEKAAAAGVAVLAPENALTTECDIVAPCALGAVLDSASVSQLRCAVVCGAANNQLLDDTAADALAQRGIVYAPDYVVNAGGIINIAEEWAPGGYSLENAQRAAARIEQTTAEVFRIANDDGITTARAADELGRRRIMAEGTDPYRPGAPSVMHDALLKRAALFRR
jgi:leucine dehydrogenase